MAITFSGSCPRFKSSVSFKPFRSVSSRMSLISLILPSRVRSLTLSMMASSVVVGGMWFTSTMFSSLLYTHVLRTRTLPRPVL